MSLTRPHLDFRVRNIFDEERRHYDHCHVAYCMTCAGEDYVIIKKNSKALPHAMCAEKFRQRGWDLGKNRKRDTCPECVQTNQKGKVIDFNREPTIESVFGSAPIPPKDRPPTPRELAQKLTKKLKAAAAPKKIHEDLPEVGFETVEAYVRQTEEVVRQAKKMNTIAERMLDEACALNDVADVHTAKALELIEALPEERKGQMAFELVVGRRGGMRLDGRACRLSITKSGDTKNGRLIISKDVLVELGWTWKSKLEIHRGTEKDSGRVLIVPGLNHVAQLQEAKAGSPHQHGLVQTRVVFDEFERIGVTDVHFQVHPNNGKKPPHALIIDIPKEGIPADYKAESTKIGVATA